jgi:hypothetical protein
MTTFGTRLVQAAQRLGWNVIDQTSQYTHLVFPHDQNEEPIPLTIPTNETTRADQIQIQTAIDSLAHQAGILPYAFVQQICQTAPTDQDSSHTMEIMAMYPVNKSYQRWVLQKQQADGSWMMINQCIDCNLHTVQVLLTPGTYREIGENTGSGHHVLREFQVTAPTAKARGLQGSAAPLHKYQV